MVMSCTIAVRTPHAIFAPKRYFISFGFLFSADAFKFHECLSQQVRSAKARLAKLGTVIANYIYIWMLLAANSARTHKFVA